MSAIQRFEVGPRMSECSVFNGIVHLAGQVADDASGDVVSQTAQVLAQIDRLLAQAGSGKDRILMMQIFLKDIKDFPVRARHAYPRALTPSGADMPRAPRRPGPRCRR
jgi:enamine deaminase RidA (YjgF/YER057c/UK114 family)